MPPCQSFLINKVHRTNCVACLWRRAPLPTPCTIKAEAHGWSLENGTYKIKWYDGDQLPQGVLEILNDGNTSTSEEADIDQAVYDSSDESAYEDDEYIYLWWNKCYEISNITNHIDQSYILLHAFVMYVYATIQERS